jgi:hypothetical protein
MATDREHLRQAEHNQHCFDALDQAHFPDWAATIAFYKAVHLVQALFQLTGDSCGSHSARNDILKKKFPRIWRQYHPLYSFSRLARYWCLKVKPEHVQQIVRRLRKLEKEVKLEHDAHVAKRAS